MTRSRLPILTLFAANAVSLSGNVAALVAIPWFVLQTTGSASKTGITAFAGLLPWTYFSEATVRSWIEGIDEPPESAFLAAVEILLLHAEEGSGTAS